MVLCGKVERKLGESQAVANTSAFEVKGTTYYSGHTAFNVLSTVLLLRHKRRILSALSGLLLIPVTDTPPVNILDLPLSSA